MAAAHCGGARRLGSRRRAAPARPRAPRARRRRRPLPVRTARGARAGALRRARARPSRRSTGSRAPRSSMRSGATRRPEASRSSGAELAHDPGLARDLADAERRVVIARAGASPVGGPAARPRRGAARRASQARRPVAVSSACTPTLATALADPPYRLGREALERAARPIPRPAAWGEGRPSSNRCVATGPTASAGWPPRARATRRAPPAYDRVVAELRREAAPAGRPDVLAGGARRGLRGVGGLGARRRPAGGARRRVRARPRGHGGRGLRRGGAPGVGLGSVTRAIRP